MAQGWQAAGGVEQGGGGAGSAWAEPGRAAAACVVDGRTVRSPPKYLA